MGLITELDAQVIINKKTDLITIRSVTREVVTPQEYLVALEQHKNSIKARQDSLKQLETTHKVLIDKEAEIRKLVKKHNKEMEAIQNAATSK